MSDLLEVCRALLDGYEGENKEVLQGLWDYYEAEGTLEKTSCRGLTTRMWI